MRDVSPLEKRVALVPEDVGTLVREGFSVRVSRGAGEGAFIGDDDYSRAGAVIADDAEAAASDAVVSLQDPGSLAPSLASGAVFVGVFDPLWAPEQARCLNEAGVSSFSLDLVPRITRAQSMDVLSSMATIAGYEAVLLAASRLPKMFPLMMTAAGTVKPARVLVLGAGVAGLQAIAAARRLGAVVEAYDVRPEALEQIRSMGARSLEIGADDPSVGPDSSDAPGSGADAVGADDPSAAAAGSEVPDGRARSQSERFAARQQESLAPHVAAADVLVTTAAIPGRASPLLVTAEMVDLMEAGSVVIDLAAQRGGNCEATRADAETVRNGVTVLGPTNLPSRCARHASQMFSRNLTAFLRHLAPGGVAAIDEDDEIVAAMSVTRDGSTVNPAVKAAAAMAAGSG